MAIPARPQDRNVTREGRRLVDTIFRFYIDEMINDGDAKRAKSELIDVMQAEVDFAVRWALRHQKRLRAAPAAEGED